MQAKSQSFVDALEEAQKRPEPSDGFGGVLSPFDRIPDGDKVVDTNEVPKAKPVKFPYKATLKKFHIGYEDQVGINEYEDIINTSLRGDIIIRFEERTITKEGDLIIVLSYLTPFEDPAKKEQEVQKKEEEAERERMVEAIQNRDI